MVDHILQAIAEPHRREILLLLQTSELSASEIAAHFTDVTRPAISQHLTLLAQVGLVTMRRQGTNVSIALVQRVLQTYTVFLKVSGTSNFTP